MIVGKIDITKVDKTAFFKGAKGTYLDIALIDTPDNQYGDDFMIVQSLSKERREAGEKGAILGNARHLDTQPREEQPQQPPAQAPQPPAAASDDDDGDSLPF